MRRRRLLALLGGAAAVPYASYAQLKPIPAIGFLSSRAAAESSHLVAAFRQGLKQGGYIEGETISVEYRWADNQYDRLPAMAAELVHHPVSVIVAAGGPPSALAAKAATAAIPIVFTSVGNPVEIGLVASLGRPGGNVTGSDSTLTTELEPKRLELLHEFVPMLTAVGVLLNSNRPKMMALPSVQAAARTLGLELVVLWAHDAGDLDETFTSLVQQRLGALLI